MNRVVQEVTQRIIERSRENRTKYLKHLEAARPSLFPRPSACVTPILIPGAIPMTRSPLVRLWRMP